MDNQLPPEEQNLIRAIQAVPKPKLDPAVRDAIRERMVSEFRAVNLGKQPHSPSIRPRFAMQLSAVLVATVMLVIIGLVIAQIGNQNPGLGTSTVTASSESQVAVVPSVTLASTVEGATVTATATSESVPSVIPTISPATAVTPSNTPPPQTQEVIVNIEGPVTNISNNIVSIYDFNIAVEPQHPILQVIDVGDIVRVQGVLGSDNTVVATIISNILDANLANGVNATVGLDGPIEAINGGIVTVNGIPVQFSPDDPLLQTLQIGNFVSVQGNFENNGTSIVLVVVNIVVINNVVIDGNPTCWFHVDGMGMGMGHWHCDGMGMGMGDGMGDDGMGMGMGN